MVDVMGTLVRRLDDVVHFSRVLSDNLTLEERRHPLSRLLTQVTSRHAASAARRDVSLVLDGDPASVIVDCDASEIGKALSHLIMNAIEHAPPDSRVVVRAVVTDDASLVISVEDDGPGVSPEVLASLLSPYFDGQPVGNGMGLGLSVAKLVCEAHGGVLSFHTAPGRGTTALVQIPADRVSVGSRSAA
jgi:signal transduction histidine kinase